MLNSITDIEGIKVGHVTDQQAKTGCTVILTEKGFLGSCDVRGGAPGSREKALLEPRAGMNQVHAILLTGGSAFGLNAAGGVMQFLEEKEIGYDTGIVKVPIVPGAVIFDLGTGDPAVRPDQDMGYQASEKADTGHFATGNIGAGTGATVGKILGMKNCMQSGLGTASVKNGDLLVGVLAVCNAFGDIYDPDTGEIIAGARDDEGNFINSRKYYTSQKLNKTELGENTTLVVVATNANINKAETNKVASMAHNGLAKSIAPVHTMVDGDTVFVVNNKKIEDVEVGVIGTMAVEAVSEAIVKCVK